MKNIIIFRVTVATSLPELPLLIIMPRFLSDGASLLGVGDIVNNFKKNILIFFLKLLPGIFLTFLYRFDKKYKKKFIYGYFLPAWIGYGIGK